MSEPTTPHRRRTPCCEIEAFRYLDEHGFTEAALARADDGLDVERLTRAFVFSGLIEAGTEAGWAIARRDAERLAAEYARLKGEQE